jgi:hypothetical protein
VKKKGRAGVDSSVKDAQEKLGPLAGMEENGVNITDIYVCSNTDKKLSESDIQEMAKNRLLGTIRLR